MRQFYCFKHDSGFSLMEVLFSLGFLSIITAGIAPAFINHLKSITEADYRTGAIQAAQTVLDKIRWQDPQDLPLTGSDAPVVVPVARRNYSVVVSYCMDSIHCSSLNNRHLQVQVFLRDRELYEVETIYTKLK